MNFKYGFELEGFCTTSTGAVIIPPKNYPTDGFPGLVEIRTQGGDDIEKQYFKLLSGVSKYLDVHFGRHEHVFTPKEKVLLRARHSDKGELSISNVYGKDPRHLGDRTLASFQINISNLLRGKNAIVRDGRLVTEPAQYGLFDFVPIVKRLDEEFANEIRAANRQPGFYAIKEEVRLEYRSLPNSVANLNIYDAAALIKRITKCVNGN